ncbi:MAG: energy transducer TonB, partial [Acidobacteriota bacterium]|nr:energy transducer TonB [Acidobacteriota bacterium]
LVAGPSADGPPPPPPPVYERPASAAVNGGVLNGKAISKPAPAYPPIARAARAQGTVVVFIVVDESGRVVSANAESGHPLLQQAAVRAAREARLTPTLLSGRPVKVAGRITYNFVLPE